MQQQLKKQEKQWKKRMQEVSVTHQQQLAEVVYCVYVCNAYSC